MSRPVLSSKPSNISSPSPTKSKSRSSSNSPFKCSPPKRSKLSPVKFKPTNSNDGKLSFTIFEDKKVDQTTREFNDLDIEGKENTNTKTKQTKHNLEQENILQPTLKTFKQNTLHLTRTPLGQLDIDEFKGQIIQNGIIENLSIPFVPKHFENDSNSAHKFHHNLPSFVSPMKSNTRFLFKSGLNVIHDGLEENEFNADDELEYNLLQKSLALKRNGHQRSFSLGKNDLKHGLIKKNGFTILSN